MLAWQWALAKGPRHVRGILLLMLCRTGAEAAELLCHSNPQMVAASAARIFPKSLRAFVWSGNQQCLMSAGGDSAVTSPACHWEANVTAGETWQVEETLQGHSDAVCAVAWSADGKYVLTGSADSTARIWWAPPATVGNATPTGGRPRGQTFEALTGVSPVAMLEGHEGAVNAVTFSPDGRMALTGGLDGTVRTWQAPASQVVPGNISEARQDEVDNEATFTSNVAGNTSTDPNCTNSSCAASAASVLEAAAFYAGDSGGWTLAAYLQGHADAIWSVGWPAERTRVLVGPPDRTACMWLPPLSGGRTMEAVVLACSSTELGTRWRARGATELRDSYDRTARIWESRWEEGGRRPPQWRIEARVQDRHMHNHLVTVAAWSPDGTRLLTGSRDGIARMWHTGGFAHGTGKDPAQWELMATLKGHVDIIWAVAWAPDSKYVLTGGRDNFTHVWTPSEVRPYQWEVAGTLQEIKCLFTIDHAVQSVYYGGVNMTPNVTGNFSDWERDKGLTISVIPGAWLVITGYNNQPRSCSTGGFSITCTNGVTSADHRWEAFGSPQPIDHLHKIGNGTGWGTPCKSRSRFHLTADRFANKLYATDDRYAVFRIRLATQQAHGLDFFRRRIDAGGGHVGNVPIGVTADGNKDGLMGDLQREFVASPTPAEEYSFVPGGETGHFPPVWVAAWSPDGQKIMTASRDGSVRVWQLISHRPMQWSLAATLRGHTGMVWSVAWSPNGRRALTAGHDGLVRIWRMGEPETPEVLGSFDLDASESVFNNTASDILIAVDAITVNMSNISNASDGALVAASSPETRAADSNTSNMSNETSHIPAPAHVEESHGDANPNASNVTTTNTKADDADIYWNTTIVATTTNGSTTTNTTFTTTRGSSTTNTTKTTTVSSSTTNTTRTTTASSSTTNSTRSTSTSNTTLTTTTGSSSTNSTSTTNTTSTTTQSSSTTNTTSTTTASSSTTNTTTSTNTSNSSEDE